MFDAQCINGHYKHQRTIFECILVVFSDLTFMVTIYSTKMLTEFIFEVVLIIIVGVIGVVGNCIAIIMFSRMKKKQLKFHRLMILLSCFDTIYILLSFVLFTIPASSEGYKYRYHPHVVPVAIPIIQIALTGSVYCTTAISIERYLTVCRPFLTASHNWSAKRYIVPILIFSLLYNIPRFFELQPELRCIGNERRVNFTGNGSVFEINTTTPAYGTFQKSSPISTVPLYEIKNSKEYIGNITDKCEDYMYSLELTEMRKNKYYYSIYTIGLNFLLMGLVPFVILAVSAILTLKRLLVLNREEDNVPTQSNGIRCDSIIRNINNSVNIGIIRNESQGNVFLSTNVLNPTQDNTSTSSDTYRPFTISRRLRANEIMLSRVGLGITFVFIICHSIRWIPNIYELIERIKDKDIPWPSWVESFTYVSHFLTVLNSSVHFYIYYFARNEITSKINCFKNITTSERRNSSRQLTQANWFPMESNNRSRLLSDTMSTRI